VSALDELAGAVGLARHWRDAAGHGQTVCDEALVAVLHALAYEAGSEAEVASSLDRRRAELAQPPAFLSADIDTPVVLPGALRSAGAAELELETGEIRRFDLGPETRLAISEPGYHRLRSADWDITIAVAPPRCLVPADLLAKAGRSPARLWGPAIQIPSLRGPAPSAFGDLGNLREAVALFAARGADAVAISPVHALFPGRGAPFSPYSPSSRLALNTLLADPRDAGLPPFSSGTPGELIDWAREVPVRFEALTLAFAHVGPEQRRAIATWADERGPAIRRHALFDALSRHFRDRGSRWQDWPAEYHDPDGEAVARFAHEQAEAVELHLFGQWLAEMSLARAQSAASHGGMAIGLISDLAVGIDPGGSDAWAMREAMLQGLTIGAPPDPLGPDGQNWNLTGFSPEGLQRSAFAPWIAMLRASLRHAGGVRIDHAFGLQRLWVVPEGGSAADGAYLSYPRDDLMRIAALESHRAGAIVIGEDLGTRPDGFMDAVAARNIYGMRVLWFERSWDGRFITPEEFAPPTVAMTGTHDTATIAGWWRGRDLAWNRRLGRGSDWDGAEHQRAEDRHKLWAAIGHGAFEPAVDDPEPVVEQAIAHLGQARSELAIVPLEDLLALDEQPNLPGTIAEHPNWRRRLSSPLADLLAEPVTARRIAALVAARNA
jgi:4-alpha-glucanotransferase